MNTTNTLKHKRSNDNKFHWPTAIKEGNILSFHIKMLQQRIG